MRKLRMAALGVIVTQLFAAPPASASSKLFTLSDPRITEASGLACGLRSPGVLYVQNDSGDSARFFALDSRTGRTRAVYTVPDATNVDWEDLAAAVDTRGVDSVWIADIGDNDERRNSIAVYRVDEPVLGAAASAVTGAPEVWRLRYPDRPHNAEALAVDSRRKVLYVATKALSGRSDIFAVGMDSDGGRSQVMDRVGSVQLGFTGTPGGPNVLGQVTVTGAAMSADGTRFVLRTYTDAYLWQVRGTLHAALSTPPVRVALPAQPLGEGIAFSGTDLLIDSEKVGSPVYRIPTSSSASTSPAEKPQVPAEKPQVPAEKPQVAVPDASNRSLMTWAIWIAALLAGGLLLARIGSRRSR